MTDRARFAVFFFSVPFFSDAFLHDIGTCIILRQDEIILAEGLEGFFETEKFGLCEAWNGDGKFIRADEWSVEKLRAGNGTLRGREGENIERTLLPRNSTAKVKFRGRPWLPKNYRPARYKCKTKRVWFLVAPLCYLRRIISLDRLHNLSRARLSFLTTHDNCGIKKALVNKSKLRIGWLTRRDN